MIGRGSLPSKPSRLQVAALERAARADDALGEVLRSGAVHGVTAETLLAIL